MRLLIVFLAMVTSVGLYAQHKSGFINAGLEYNYYPAGHMIMLQAEYAILQNPHKAAFSNPHHTMHFKLGVNLAQRTGMSPMNDEEYGWGPGAAVGYRYYFSKRNRTGYDGFYLGGHIDLWHLSMHWKDSAYSPRSGHTSTLVVQPMLDIGFKKQWGKWDVILGLNNGFEINVITNGKEVGQGWITSGQLVFARRLY